MQIKKRFKNFAKRTRTYWFLLGAYESRRVVTSDVKGRMRENAYDNGRAKAQKVVRNVVWILTFKSITI